MKECEESLNIKIKYQNSLGTHSDDQSMQDEVDRLINRKSSEQLPCAYTDSLMQFYKQTAAKDDFVQRLVTELINCKKVLNRAP
jgi:hypothetical protein